MFKKILCATDLNNASNEAMKKTIQLAGQYNSSVIMLNVHEEFMAKDERRMLRVSIDVLKNQFEEIALDAKKEMKESVQELNVNNIDVEYIICNLE